MRRNRASRRLLSLLVALALVACGSTTKYVAPVAPVAKDQQSCIASCEVGQGMFGKKKPGGENAVYDYDCLAKCPDVKVVDGECAPEDKADGKFCFEKHEKGAVAEVIGGGIALTVLVITLVWALGSRTK